MSIQQITELFAAVYGLCTVLGHLPFLPKAFTDVMNRIALDLKPEGKTEPKQ